MLERGKILLELKHTQKAIESLKKVKQIHSKMYAKAIEHEAELLLEKIEYNLK